MNLLAVKHTPGPWELAPSGYRVVWIGRNSIGEISCSGVICDTANNAATRTPTNNANARLIAAAPEMLEALERLVAESIQNLMDIDLSEKGLLRARSENTPLGKAETVIRKAKGEL